MFLRQTSSLPPPITPLGATITGALVLSLYLLLVPLTALILVAIVQRLEILRANAFAGRHDPIVEV